MIKIKLDEDFFAVNPEFLSFKTCKEIIKKYRAKIASDIMWSLTLYHHPKASTFNMEEESRVDFIQKEFLSGKKVTMKAVLKYSEFFLKFCLIREQRSVFAWAKKIDERDKFLLEQEYTLDNWSELDKMASATPKVISVYQKAYQEMVKAEENGVTKGGLKESASEKGLL